LVDGVPASASALNSSQLRLSSKPAASISAAASTSRSWAVDFSDCLPAPNTIMRDCRRCS
jgi:hypothetical protein